VLISNAYAQTAAAAAGPMDSIAQFLPIILMFVVIYFMMIRPQQKKTKEHKALIEALAKGDEVMTVSGMAGRISKVTDDFVTVTIAENVDVQMQKIAVAVVLPKGTIKNL
jgi:preprotein translocase subunit YajC